MFYWQKDFSLVLLSHQCFSARYCLWDISLKSDEGEGWGVGGAQILASLHLDLEDSEVEGQVFCFSPRDQNTQQCNENDKRITDWDDTPVTDREHREGFSFPLPK